MFEFFRGWRRKTGTIFLMLALLLMTCWLRSRFRMDLVQLPIGRVALAAALGRQCLFVLFG